VAFSRNGQRLASGSTDSTILVWDITGGTANVRDADSELSTRQVEQLWLQLAEENAAKGDEALWRLVLAARQAVPFLKKQLRPVAAPDSDRIQRLLSELDNSSFAVREKAARDLANIAEAAAPALRKALAGKPSLEVRRRIESLLAALETPVGPRLQQLRAVDVLEHIGTPEARDVLKTIASGAPEARLTQEAKESLERLANRAAAKP
jgi:hypothetical protein